MPSAACSSQRVARSVVGESINVYVLTAGFAAVGRIHPLPRAVERFETFLNVWRAECGASRFNVIPCRTEMHPIRGCGIQRAFAECFRRSLKAKDTAAIFLEDDAIPIGYGGKHGDPKRGQHPLCSPSFRERLSGCAPSESANRTTVMLLGGHLFRNQQNVSDQSCQACSMGFVHMSKSHGAYGFYVRRQTIKRLVGRWEAQVHKRCTSLRVKKILSPDFDWYKSGRVYATEPLLMGHARGMSATWGVERPAIVDRYISFERTQESLPPSIRTKAAAHPFSGTAFRTWANRFRPSSPGSRRPN